MLYTLFELVNEDWAGPEKYVIVECLDSTLSLYVEDAATEYAVEMYRDLYFDGYEEEMLEDVDVSVTETKVFSSYTEAKAAQEYYDADWISM